MTVGLSVTTFPPSNSRQQYRVAGEPGLTGDMKNSLYYLGCPSGWNDFQGNCYLYGGEKRFDWQSAENHCQSLKVYIHKCNKLAEERLPEDTVFIN